MTRNVNTLDDLHEMFTAAGIEHHYTSGDAVITVIRGDHAWTISEECCIYWGGNGLEVCKPRWHGTSWAADAYDYISDVYSKVK